MTPKPLVSVVMSVYNGASRLRETLDSVLEQTGCDFEFVIVDDGSTDATGALLDDCAVRDARVIVIHQENTGLTGALIKGCAAATGKYIARQDAADRSLPGRLREQAHFLETHPEAVAVAGSVSFLAPDGEPLFRFEAPEVIELSLDPKKIRAPPLVGAMFRRDSYLAAGGFRPQFVVAQDIDLWLRLIEAGPCLGLGRIHYEARWLAEGISSRRREEQLLFTSLAVRAATRRRSGESDLALFDRLPVTTRRKGPVSRVERAKLNYFIAACLRDSDPVAARKYLGRVISDNPFHLKARLRFLLR